MEMCLLGVQWLQYDGCWAQLPSLKAFATWGRSQSWLNISGTGERGGIRAVPTPSFNYNLTCYLRMRKIT